MMYYLIFAFMFGVPFALILRSVIDDIKDFKNARKASKTYTQYKMESDTGNTKLFRSLYYNKSFVVFCIVLRILVMAFIFMCVIGLIALNNSNYGSYIF